MAQSVHFRNFLSTAMPFCQLCNFMVALQCYIDGFRELLLILSWIFLKLEAKGEYYCL